MATVVVVVLGAAALVVVAAWVFQRQLIYLPYGEAGNPQAAGLAAAETVALETEDGLVLEAWFVPAAGDAVGTVLVLPGNAGNRSMRTPLGVPLRAAGYHVLLVDYRGFGGNPGRPSEDGLAADARAALAHLRQRDDVDPHRIVFYGESLGAGVAVRLAAEDPPVGLVLRSPFPSLAEVGRLHYPFLPVTHLLRDRFPVAETLRDYGGPVLVVAGTADEIVPPELSARVARAAPDGTLVTVPADGHNDPALLAGDELIEAVLDFLDTTLTAGGP